MYRRRTRRTRTVNTAGGERRVARLALVRAVVLVVGLLYFVIGLALLLEPEWFFANVGNFAPYNRHYLGDLGSFLLPLGVGLTLASQDPVRHRMLITIGVAGSIIHALNHLYDASLGDSAAFWVTDTLPLLILAGVFLWALWHLRPRR